MKKNIWLGGIFILVMLVTGCGNTTTPSKVYDGSDSVEPFGKETSQFKPDFERVDSWQTFNIKDLGFSIKLPFMPGQVRQFDEFYFLYVSCTALSCGDKQYAVLGDLREEYKVLGSVSKDYNVGSSWSIHELHDATIKANSVVLIGPRGKTREVPILKKFKNTAGTLEGVLVPVKQAEDITQKDAFSGEEGYAAVFKTPQANKKFKAVVFYFKTADLPLVAFEKALGTIVVDTSK